MRPLEREYVSLTALRPVSPSLSREVREAFDEILTGLDEFFSLEPDDYALKMRELRPVLQGARKIKGAALGCLWLSNAPITARSDREDRRPEWLRKADATRMTVIYETEHADLNRAQRRAQRRRLAAANTP